MSVDVNKVVFIIPFRSKASTTNWEVVCQNLVNTIKSIENQTNSNFHIIIVANEKPMFLQDSSRITLAISDFKIPGTYAEMQFDIRAKLFEGMRIARRYAPCYLFRMDADDLLRRDIVDKILASQTQGYYFYFGYDLSVKTKKLMLRPRFYMNCGTAHVLKLTEKDFPDATSKIDSKDWFHDIWNHQHIAKLFHVYAGRKIWPFLGAPVLRIVNTGNNMEFNRENSFKGFKGFIAKNFLYKRMTKAVIKNFSIPKNYVS